MKDGTTKKGNERSIEILETEIFPYVLSQLGTIEDIKAGSDKLAKSVAGIMQWKLAFLFPPTYRKSKSDTSEFVELVKRKIDFVRELMNKDRDNLLIAFFFADPTDISGNRLFSDYILGKAGEKDVEEAYEHFKKAPDRIAKARVECERFVKGEGEYGLENTEIEKDASGSASMTALKKEDVKAPVPTATKTRSTTSSVDTQTAQKGEKTKQTKRNIVLDIVLCLISFRFAKARQLYKEYKSSTGDKGRKNLHGQETPCESKAMSLKDCTSNEIPLRRRHSVTVDLNKIAKGASKGIEIKKGK